MAEYEAVRQQHLARLGELIPELMGRLSWTREQVGAEREPALRAILAHARAHSPWHRRRLAAVDVERVSADDLGALPVMTKDDLMTHFDEIVTDARLTRDVVEAHLAALTTDAYLVDEFHVCASGGSSGRRGAFVYDFDAWAICFASFVRFSARRLAEVIGPDAVPPVMAMVAADKASHMTSAMAQTFTMPGREVERLPATWPLERIVAGLNALRPEYVTGYTSLIHQLTHEATAGRLRIAPKLVAATSEPVLPETRAAVTAAWGAPLFNGFGSTEGLMGGSCGAGRGIHLSDDLFVIEPVDATGAPVPAGERAAKVYLTSLYNRTQPLIRYELTDEMTVLDGPCPCGMGMVRIDDIQGRLDDCFTWSGGPTVHPFAFRSPLGRERGIVEYQVRQTPRGADVLVVCQGRVDTKRLADTLRHALVDQGLTDPQVSVTSVAALERQASGKLKRFVPWGKG